MKLYILFFILFHTSVYASEIHIISLVNCPYYCQDTKKDKGFAVDIVSHIFKEAGYKLTYTSYTSQKEALNSFNLGNSDIILGLNSQDNKNILFMQKPLAYTYNVIATQPYLKLTYYSSNSLKNLRFAAIKELSYDKELRDYIHTYKDNSSKVQITSGHFARKHNLKKLRFDKVDALIDDRISLRYFYYQKKKPFSFKIRHTSISSVVKIGIHNKSYRAKKYDKLLTKGLKKLENTKELKGILKKYGLTEAYIRKLP